DQNELDINKATAVAEHAAQMQQNTAKVTTNLQMKTAQQTHDHTLAQAKVSNTHELAKAKAGIQPPTAPGASSSPAASTQQPVGDQPGQQKRTITEFAEMRTATEELVEEGFVFAGTEKGTQGEVTYSYLHPDRRSVLVTYKQGPTPVADSSVAAGTG